MIMKPGVMSAGSRASLWPVLAATGLTFVPAAGAGAFTPKHSIGRLQTAYDNVDTLRLSQSWFGIDAARRFLLEALDRNDSHRRRAEDSTRLQLFFGGPITGDGAFGWVGRFDDVWVGTGEHLADLRVGGQISIDRLVPSAGWFKRHRIQLFTQVFPVRTNEDFGRVDTFTRFAIHFSPTVAARGVIRTYHFADEDVVTFENDFIYSIDRRHDVFLRVGKSNRDRSGLAQRRFTLGVGLRLNF